MRARAVNIITMKLDCAAIAASEKLGGKQKKMQQAAFQGSARHIRIPGTACVCRTGLTKQLTPATLKGSRGLAKVMKGRNRL